MADFKVEVPIDVGGKAGAAKEGAGKIEKKSIKELEKLNQGVKKLDKSVLLTVDIYEILTSLLSDVYAVLRPFFKLLSIILLLIFMPLMPIYKDLIKGLAEVVKFLAKLTRPGGEGMESIIKEQGKLVSGLIAGIVAVAGAAMLFIVGGWIVVLLGVIAALIIANWENLGEILNAVWQVFVIEPLMRWGTLIMAVWESVLLPAWKCLANAPKWIWEKILLPSWIFLRDVGKWIWDIISAPFRWLADQIGKIADWFKKALGGKIGKMMGFAKGGTVPGPIGAPQLAVVHGGERIVPVGGGSSIVININKPTVRSDSDLKNLAQELSRVLQRSMAGRISSG